jgi:hypothetical protein
MPPKDDKKEEKALVGRTVWDLIHDSESWPKWDQAMSRTAGFVLGVMDVAGAGLERLRGVAAKVGIKLEARGIEPKAIPERVGMSVLQAVVLEDRDEIRELWANLLVSAATGEEVDDYAIGIVKQLSPDAARLLPLITKDTNEPPPESGWMLLGLGKVVGDRMVLTDQPLPPAFSEVIPDRRRLELAVSRLEALGLVKPGSGAVVDHPGRTTIHRIVVLTRVGEFIVNLVGGDD